MSAVDLAEELARISEAWSPEVVGELNGQQVKVAKFRDEFVWHRHEREDELFLVLSGRLAIHLRDRMVELSPGQLFIVPRGTEHKPVADGEAHVLLFEPASTRRTGDADGVESGRGGDRPEYL